MSRTRPRRLALAVAALLCTLLAACGEAPAADFPADATHPRPVTRDFDGCPPTGDGGDAQLNRLKNRIDDGDNGSYFDVDLETLVTLPYPAGVERVRFQVWRRQRGALVCVERTDEDRVKSVVLGAFLREVGIDGGRRVRLGTGPRGESLFPSAEEAAASEIARLEEGAEAAASEIARLRAELEKLRG